MRVCVCLCMCRLFTLYRPVNDLSLTVEHHMEAVPNIKLVKHFYTWHRHPDIFNLNMKCATRIKMHDGGRSCSAKLNEVTISCNQWDPYPFLLSFIHGPLVHSGGFFSHRSPVNQTMRSGRLFWETFCGWESFVCEATSAIIAHNCALIFLFVNNVCQMIFSR